MGKIRIWLPCYYLFMILVLGFSPCVWCAPASKQTPANANANPTAVPVLASFIYGQLANLTKVFHKDITQVLGFCIDDVDAELFEAFNFAKNLEFLNNCFKETKDVTQRLCNAAEMKFYFSSFLETKSTQKANILRPNRNCNLTSWVPGCEPGWSCSVNKNEKVDLKNAKDMPDRTRDYQPCCEGFFCPKGLTCMMPCPLGAYCPHATLNKTTGLCEPYSYQLPPGKVNHTCGAADRWGSETDGGELFCSPGSYCPTTTKKVICSEGNYCRKGSTAPRECIKLSNCHKQSEKQKLHVIGFILIGALSFILIIFYNCSDQVINTKYQRVAKSREAAARHARETAQARERWGLVKDVAKKRAFGLQQQLSRTFSKKMSVKQGARGAFNLPKTNDEASIPPKGPSSSAGKGKKKEPSDLTKMMHSIENETDNMEGFHMQIGDKNIKKQAINAKKLHTRSQIFKYAYGQLEKEKAMEQKTKNMTFSGVISMATDDNTEIKTRPPIEISFKDLTITLKKKHKHLMRSVTGKLMPGRISAVMGPSGAGKTTFLSAVAGKLTQCTLSGIVLINGRAESIHSYKRITGFVAQDDIVHGNLTVEENLRFNARCRLAADLPKADKVLVVERVIESLGLQAVRDSLVGTVEKRGISGGQRKRVNVGMEMVMEPSLLILDEPTSGLDSSSSNLLLKALRREALEGVNICMVLHQPSYTLYKMFDDLVLLAKGGLVAYHGPVKKAEEYFANLGIAVPDRVNPPDHFIDVLEGMVKPGGGVTVEQLPVRWMLHNGYPVPPDMMQLCDEIAMSSKGLAAAPDQSFSVDAWHEKRDSLSHGLLKSHDLSNRNTPGINRQYRYYLGRVGKQRLREAQIQAADYLILLVAGACLGILSSQKGDTFGYSGYTYSIIAVSLLCKIAALRSFSLDKLEYWRERESGLSSLAYFLSKDTIDHFNTVIKPLVYLSMFYFLNSLRSSFGTNYLVFLCLVYCVTGIAYVFAICFAPGQAQLWCVLVPVVLTLIANQEPDSTAGKLAKFCYPRWALEAFVVASAQRYSGVWLIARCGKLLELGFDVHSWNTSLILLILTGVVSRLIAYVCLVCLKKK
ncbi:hypothetical protein RDI58_021732 [Solanum bulbocastanum]|uniref:ABC transporter domain-containing protein n=1 Tax=Solanum bulbocastanum TaxID=147425 RepID=A0AAN8Y7G1_SOLBU